MSGEKKANVVVLLDGQNLFYTLYQNGRMFNPSEVKQVVDNWCRKRGFSGAKFVAAKYYTDATKDLHYITARRLDTANFEIIHCFTTEHEGSEPKSTVDQSLGKGMIWASGDYVDADMIVIGVGDRDLLQSIQAAIEYLDKEVVLLCTPYATSQNLKDFICEKYDEDHIITIYGEERTNDGKTTAPTISWSREELEAHCAALFAETTPEGIEHVLQCLPEHLAVVIEGTLVRAIETIQYQEDKGKHAPLGHIKNLIIQPRPPVEKPKWAGGVEEGCIMTVLVQMAEAGILERHVLPDQSLTYYTVNWGHPFVMGVASRHPGIRAELAVQEPKEVITNKLNSDEFKEILPKKEILPLIEPIRNELPVADEADAPGRLAHEMDEGPAQHGETHNPPTTTQPVGWSADEPEAVESADDADFRSLHKLAATDEPEAEGTEPTGDSNGDTDEYPGDDYIPTHPD